MNHLIKLALLLSFFIQFLHAACPSNPSGPTDNPISTFYGTNAYPWTSSFKWDCVFNANNYKGSPDEIFLSAQKDAIANGGGVIYFPAGTYTFKDALHLESNIVIRGEVSRVDGSAKKGDLIETLKTTFVFPDRQHLGFFNRDNSSNLAVVNILSEGGPIMFWPQFDNWNETFNLKGSFYNAKKVLANGMNKLVFGSVFRSVSYIWPDPEKPNQGNQWPYKFGISVAVYSGMNALVANVQIPKSDKTAKTTVTLKGNPDFHGTVPYIYDNRYGIDMGQLLYGAVISQLSNSGKCPGSGQFPYLTPECAPFFFGRNLVVRDNSVYQNGRVGIMWSGGGDGKTIGSGTQIINNHVEVAKGTTCYSIGGERVAKGSDTNENRGYNQEGWGSNVTLNTGHINRQYVPGGKYLTVDGEGVLHQAFMGTDGRRTVWESNDMRGGETGYMLYYKLDVVEDCILKNNRVNSDQSIGAVWNTKKAKNDVCSGNIPSCTGLP